MVKKKEEPVADVMVVPLKAFAQAMPNRPDMPQARATQGQVDRGVEIPVSPTMANLLIELKLARAASEEDGVGDGGERGDGASGDAPENTDPPKQENAPASNGWLGKLGGK